MDIEERLKLIKEVGEEIVTIEELKDLLRKKKQLIAYDGFEPSGNLHIAQGIMRAINVNKLIKAGIKFKFFVADWHAWANNKLGGDLERIKTTGRYQIEVWKAAGMDLDNVEFIWASDLVKDEEYWAKVMRIAINSSVKRIIRCCQIMGRKEGETLQASQIIYPCMQAADIFHLNVDMAQLGMDQRKVNMLAREIGPKIGYWKPVVVSHHMLMGLGKPVSNAKDIVERSIDLKMSKSKPDSAIFMTDNREEIKRKLSKAYCPEKKVEDNPVLEYAKYIVFERFRNVNIERPKTFGGNLIIERYEDLERKYLKGEIHPVDLKDSIAEYIDKLIEPVRNHFKKNKKAKKLLEEINSYEVTR